MNKQEDKYCPDNCPALMHSTLSGGFCDDLEHRRLKDYDIDATLVKYRKEEDCPRKG